MIYLMVILIIVLVILDVFDVVGTYAGIASGYSKETNPVMIWLMEKIGLMPALIFSKVASIVLIILIGIGLLYLGSWLPWLVIGVLAVGDVYMGRVVYKLFYGS